MRNAKRLLAALLLAAALILSLASCGGQTETESEAPAAASSEPQRDYTVQISKDTLRRTGSTSPPRRTGWGLQTSPQMMTAPAR